MNVFARSALKGLALAVLGLGISVNAAAGGSKDAAAKDSASGKAPAAQGSQFEKINLQGVTVTFWHQHSTSREEAMKKLVAEFNATNPYGITVNAEYAGGYGDIYNKMLAGLAAKQVPDLVVAYQNNAGAYQLVGGLADIEPYVQDSKFGLSAADQADFIPGIFQQDKNAQFENQRLGFPPNRSMEVMYSNVDWLAKIGYTTPPKTWKEFEDACAKATDKAAGTYGYALSTDASNLFAQAISRGADFYNADKTGYDFNKTAIADALAMLKRLYDAGYGRKIGEAYGDQTDFGNAKVMFTLGSTSGLPYYGSAVKKGTAGAFNWTVAAVPQAGTGKPKMNMYGASISIVKTTEEKQLASWLFIKWLTEPAPQKTWTELSGYFPTRSSVRASLGDYTAKNTQFGDAFAILQNADIVTEPPFASYEAVRREVSTMMNAVLDGADIKTALAELTVKANKINEEDK